MSYKVKLEIFEGPLDLLLFLIKKNELDIYDIPIATITEQYLEYLEVMRSLNLDIAGEFLVMASTLMYIKSRMLLPPSEDDEDDVEEEDPRAELVQKLLEYKRFKEGAQWLANRSILGRDSYARSSLILEDDPVRMDNELPLENISIIELLSAFKDVLSRASEQKPSLEITIDRLNIAERIQELLEELRGRESVEFLSLFTPPYERVFVILTFLALLELMRLNMVVVFQAVPFGKILIRLSEESSDYGQEKA